MDDNNQEVTEKVSNKGPRPAAKPAWKRTLSVVAILVAAVVLINAGYIGYLYASTPLDIRQPLYEHYHFRLQILVDGKAVDFAGSKFQEGYSKDNCNADLTTHPIHFHDDKGQFVHIHWEGITGGQVLKYYGWNYIGGTKGSLGYRFDELPKLQKVPIHGDVLPAVPDGAKFHVYSGDENNYSERTFNDFTSQDLEKFLGKSSNSPAHKLNQQKRQSSLLDKLQPRTYALAAADESDTPPETPSSSTPAAASTTGTATTPAPADTSTNLTTEQLTRLNNLIGNVVVFVQKDKPGADQIKARFNDLEPLSDSACGG